jgi:hypothetical protein
MNPLWWSLLLCLAGCGMAQDPLDQVLPVRGLCIAAPNPSQVDVFVWFICAAP